MLLWIKILCSKSIRISKYQTSSPACSLLPLEKCGYIFFILIGLMCKDWWVPLLSVQEYFCPHEYHISVNRPHWMKGLLSDVHLTNSQQQWVIKPIQKGNVLYAFEKKNQIVVNFLYSWVHIIIWYLEVLFNKLQMHELKCNLLIFTHPAYNNRECY